MKRKELQRFSKEVFAAAVVSLSVAGTAIPAQAANTQQATAGVVKVQEQSSEESDVAVYAEEEEETETSDVAENAQVEDGTENAVDEAKDQTGVSAEEKAQEKETETTDETAGQDAVEKSDEEQPEAEETVKDTETADDLQNANGEEIISDSADMEEEQQNVSGWGTDENGNPCYYDENGEKVQGITEIDGKVYYFSNEGEMQKNIVGNDGSFIYYFGENGAAEEKTPMKEGWILLKKKYYYVKNGEILKAQWLKVSGKKYYLEEDGTMVSGGTHYINFSPYFFNEDGSLKTGWVRQGTGSWVYYDEDGEPKTGLFTSNGKLYYGEWNEIATQKLIFVDGVLYQADADGVCTKVTKDGWNSGKYYIENGKSVTGWKKISGKWYYFDLKTGEKAASGEIEIDGKRYYFDKNGVMQTGWISISWSSQDTIIWKYAKADGSLLQNEWLKLGNTWYYFKNDRMVTGVVNIGGANHLFQADGAWVGEIAQGTTGWKQAGKDWYYLENGKLVTSKMKTIQNKKYLFDENGKMKTNWEEKVYAGDGLVDRYIRYYFGESGAAYTNQWRKLLGNSWKYYDADGKNVSKEWKQINKVWYYFDENGTAVTSDTIIDGKVYHFRTDGSYTGKVDTIKTGWKKVEGRWYYFENGSMVQSSLKTIGGKDYYFDYDGKMTFLNTEYIDGKDYYFAEDGHRVTKAGWYRTWYGSGLVYANEAGVVVESGYTSDYLTDNGKTLCLVDPKTHKVVQKISAEKSGWVQGKSGDWFYSDKTRFLVADYMIARKVKIGNKVYGFDYQGRMLKNTWSWLRDGDGYFDASGALQMNGWCDGSYFVDGYAVSGAQKIDGKEYYFYIKDLGKDARGIAMLNTKGIFEVNGTTYYYDGNGKRQKVSLKNGWNKLPNGDYCYVKNGKLQRSAAIINGRSYSFDQETGLMVRNSFCALEGKRYYFNDKGEMVKNAWIKLSADTKTSYDGDGTRYENNNYKAGDYYYAGASGQMLEGSQTINGKTYYFDYDGKWLDI